MVLIFFLYGLAFFILGLALFIYPKKGSEFNLSNNLKFIAVFGILHGINEWIDMFMLIQPSLSPSITLIRLVLLPLSFLFLVQFGVNTLVQRGERTTAFKSVPAILFIAWMTTMVFTKLNFSAGDILARYLLGIPGIYLTFYALIKEVPGFAKGKTEKVIGKLRFAAGAFFFYGILAGVIVPDAEFFPASIFNYSAFLAVFGVPVQVFRALCALFIAYPMIRILGVFQWEAEDKLKEAYDNLESQVQERTVELRKINEELEKEIAEHRRTEKALKESEVKYRTLVELATDFICTCDHEGNVTFMNQAAYKTLEVAPDEVLGQPWTKWLHPEDREKSHNRFMEMMTNGSDVFGFENRYVSKSGKRIHVLHNVRILRNAKGEIIGTQGIARDITVRKKMEEELFRARKLESLGFLAGGIAHDFNNLLTSILGNVDLALSYSDRGSKIYHRLKDAEKSSLMARDLTQQLLRFSKKDSAIKKVSSISNLLRDSTLFALSGSSVKCEFSISDELMPVEVEAAQIRQVIYHLVLNAVEAMPEGGTIRVSAENISHGSEYEIPLEDQRYIKISVHDRGMGIAGDNIHKLFDPYFTTKEMGPWKGQGLGLAICYSIIKDHDGFITVESEKGSGTTFHIFLPASQKKIPEERIEEYGIVAGQGRILVMDDEEIIRDVASEMLRSIGYEVETAKDGEEAIRLYQSAEESGKPYDLVVLDLTVPGGMGGRKTMKKLLEISPGIKAILSSGYYSEPIVAEYEKYGFSDIVSKPYNVKALSTVVQRVLKGG